MINSEALRPGRLVGLRATRPPVVVAAAEDRVCRLVLAGTLAGLLLWITIAVWAIAAFGPVRGAFTGVWAPSIVVMAVISQVRSDRRLPTN